MRIVSVCLFLISFLSPFAQSNEVNLLFVACRSGELLIDGESKGKMEAEDAHKEKLNFGEHYVQLKSGSQKFSLTINVDEKFAGKLIKIGCENTGSTTGNNVKLIDKELPLAGLLSSQTEDNFVALDQDDELKINCSVLNKNGAANISITEFGSGSEIFRKASFNLIRDEQIRIPKRGIYKIVLYTDALFGRNAKLLVERIPSPNSPKNFKTTVRYRYDTVSTEVLKTVTRVYSLTNLSHGNTTTLRVNLPPNTTYWAYWIGVGQEARQQMKQFASTLSKGASLMSANPVVQYGLGLISSLPMLNAPSTVSYKFMSAHDAQLFVSNGQYKYYTFKYGDNIATDYSRITKSPTDLTLCLRNESSMTGEDVEVRVVAFQIKKKIVMDN